MTTLGHWSSSEDDSWSALFARLDARTFAGFAALDASGAQLYASAFFADTSASASGADAAWHLAVPHLFDETPSTADPGASSPHACNSLSIRSTVFVPLRLPGCGSTVVATSRHQRHSLIIERMPFGFIIAAVSKPNSLRSSVPVMSAFCDSMRR